MTVIPLPLRTPGGGLWLAMLTFAGLQVRLVALLYYCPFHDGWHHFNGF